MAVAEGLCFPHALRESRESGGEIVHALVTHPATGERFWHAWVERGGRVYDDAGHHLTIRRFYELFEPSDVRKYSALEAAVYSLRTRHCGPWTREETGPPPRLPKPRQRSLGPRRARDPQGLFRRLGVEVPGARALGWIADREGVHHEARRGFGGQARTADHLLVTPVFEDAERIGWITTVKSRKSGAGALAIRSLLEELDSAGADIVGLLVVPDDDEYVARLTGYYSRFGFERIDEKEAGYPIMIRHRHTARDRESSNASSTTVHKKTEASARSVGRSRPRLLRPLRS